MNYANPRIVKNYVESAVAFRLTNIDHIPWKRYEYIDNQLASSYYDCKFKFDRCATQLDTSLESLVDKLSSLSQRGDYSYYAAVLLFSVIDRIDRNDISLQCLYGNPLCSYILQECSNKDIRKTPKNAAN